MILPALQRRLLLKALKAIVHDQLGEQLQTFADSGSLLVALRASRALHLQALSDQGVVTVDIELSDALYREIIQKLRFDLVSDRRHYDTQAIVDGLAHSFRDLPALSTDAAFDIWKQAAAEALPAMAAILPEAIASRIPFSEDVLALVYQELFARMPFSRSYIFRHYEHQHGGKDYLVFPVCGRRPQRLLVIFSGNVGRKTYNRYSWYWDEQEQWQGDTVCLFLNDIDSHWYVGRAGSQERTVYRDIILRVMQQHCLPASAVITVGGSMGGYAAILYAVELGLRAAIAVHPQLCFRSALRYKEGSWEASLRECGENFRDLSDEIFRHNQRPVIYLEHGDCEADLVGFDDLLAALRRRESLAILRKTANSGHLTDNPSRRQIDALVTFIEAIDTP